MRLGSKDERKSGIERERDKVNHENRRNRISRRRLDGRVCETGGGKLAEASRWKRDRAADNERVEKLETENIRGKQGRIPVGRPRRTQGGNESVMVKICRDL